MHIRCTNCGAEVPIGIGAGESSQEVVCPYCESLLFVGKQAGIPHVVMSEYVTQADAVLRLGRYLSMTEITETPRILRRQLIYLPYWQLNFKNKNKTTQWVAASVSPLEDLLSISPRSGDTGKKQADDVPEHLMVEAALLLEDAILVAQCDMSDLDAEKPATLLHVPFDKIQYQSVGETLEAYVDLVSGTVYADTTPASPQRQKSRVLGLVSAISLSLMVAVVAVAPWQLLLVLMPLLLWLMYVVIMKLLAWMGW